MGRKNRGGDRVRVNIRHSGGSLSRLQEERLQASTEPDPPTVDAEPTGKNSKAPQPTEKIISGSIGRLLLQPPEIPILVTQLIQYAQEFDVRVTQPVGPLAIQYVSVLRNPALTLRRVRGARGAYNAAFSNSAFSCAAAGIGYDDRSRGGVRLGIVLDIPPDHSLVDERALVKRKAVQPDAQRTDGGTAFPLFTVRGPERDQYVLEAEEICTAVAGVELVFDKLAPITY